MDKTYSKLNLVFAFSIFLHILYHMALLADGPKALDISSTFFGLFYKLSKVGWIGSDFILCAAGYYCFTVFMGKGKGFGTWFTVTVRHLLWIIPSYYLFLALYLSIGVKLQHLVGNSFEFHSDYWAPLLLFYSNFKLAIGPFFTGVALEGAFLLSMIVQLFVFFGLLLSIIKKQVVLPWVLILCEVCAIILRWRYSNEWHWFSYFNTLTRMDAFLAGLMLGYTKSFTIPGSLLSKHKNLIFMASGFILAITVVFTQGANLWYPLTNMVVYPGLALFSFGALNWLLEYPGAIFSPSLKVTMLVFIIYLAKLPIIYIILRLVQQLLVNSNPTIINTVFVFANISVCLLFGLFWVTVLMPILTSAKHLIVRIR